MNLTTHIFLQRPWAGRDVFDSIPDDLLSLQEEVRQAFGWSLESRKEALWKLKQSICSAERLIVVGAGSDSIKVDDFPGATFVAADGAVAAIDDFSRVLCVISDGDGAEHLERAAEFGIHIILHAHGDNVEVWKHLVAKWSLFEQPPPLPLTHQSTIQYEGMHNPGGFTDGDRALCFIQALGRSLQDIECLGFRTDYVLSLIHI